MGVTDPANIGRRGWLELVIRSLATPTTHPGTARHRARARVGVPARVVANRALALLGTFGPWEWCAPRFPSLVFHRRLGGGTVALWVRVANAERAAQELGLAFPAGVATAPGLPQVPYEAPAGTTP